MELFLLRHGIAEEISSTGRDSDRMLTEEGIQKIRRSAVALRELEIAPDLILSSPYARAFQTAKIVAEILDMEKSLNTTEALIGVAPFQVLLQELANWNAASILLVGHEPHLSQFISLLVSGSPNLHITMKKGGFCKLTTPGKPAPGSASLDWLLAPKHLVKIS